MCVCTIIGAQNALVGSPFWRTSHKSLVRCCCPHSKCDFRAPPPIMNSPSSRAPPMAVMQIQMPPVFDKASQNAALPLTSIKLSGKRTAGAYTQLITSWKAVNKKVDSRRPLIFFFSPPAPQKMWHFARFSAMIRTPIDHRWMSNTGGKFTGNFCRRKGFSSDWLAAISLPFPICAQRPNRFTPFRKAFWDVCYQQIRFVYVLSNLSVVWLSVIARFYIFGSAAVTWRFKCAQSIAPTFSHFFSLSHPQQSASLPPVKWKK